MLHLDVSSALAKAITPTMGVPEQELTTLATGMRRYVEDWLKEREGGMHGWTMTPYDQAMVKRIKEEAAWFRGERFQTVLWIGIGGSSLAPRVIQEVFESEATVDFIVLDSIDPAALALTLDVVDWRSTLVVVASKSGGTLEPMSIFLHCYERLKRAKGAKAANRVLALTDPYQGPLHTFCIEQDIRILPIPPDVGGRYCAFTAVGLLPVALLGADVDSFVRGAKEMDTLCQNTNVHENPAAMLAAMQFLLDTKRNYMIRVIMPYAARLQTLARWDQQLIAESLGKTETGNPIPVAAIGTQDQHSLLQQWLAGPRRQWHLFIREEEKERLLLPEEIAPPLSYLSGKSFGQLLDACYTGTSEALTAAKRPHVTITLPRLDESHLGQLFFLLLTEVLFLGKLYRIDPYGQPAVELGKTVTREILAKGKGENLRTGTKR